MKQNENPLYGIEIGSTVNSTTGKFSGSVIKGSITKMVSQTLQTQSMSGTSNYVYTDQMNKGSFGFSGNFGVSGISKVKTSLSGYLGNSKADNSTSINANYNTLVEAGIEYINFNELDVESIINSLTLAQKDAITKALDAFNNVNTRIKELKISSYNVEDLLNNEDPELKNLLKVWFNKKNYFESISGDSVVVGILWGGIATVSIEMTNKKNENNWKYGGMADFSYSGIGNSVSVGATYDGSNTKRSTDIEVNVTSTSFGKCVASQTNEWFNLFAKKSFDELVNVRPLESAPNIATEIKTPKIPDFRTPPKEKSITDKISKIKNLEGLQAFAEATAYENAKKKDSGLTLKDFLEKSKKKADVTGLENIQNEVNNNYSSVIKNPKKPDDNFAISIEKSAPHKDNNNANLEDYVPLGAWITKWSDIFPWLAEGFDNNVLNSTEFQSILRLRTLIQDLKTLSMIYYIAANNEIAFYNNHGELEYSTNQIKQIADSFANQLALMLDSNDTIEKRIENAINGLSKVTKHIYENWDYIKVLRNGELGFAVLNSDRMSVKKEVADNVYYLDSCSFDYTNENYSAFSSFYKFLPIFLPSKDSLSRPYPLSERDMPFFIFGPGKGLLHYDYQLNPFLCTFRNSNTTTTVFRLYKDGISKGINSRYLSLYPIPFSAAKGIEWKGQSVSTNLSSFKDLNMELKKVQEQLQSLNSYTFSSESWDQEWNGETPYSLRKLKTQYFGLISEPHSVFNNKTYDKSILNKIPQNAIIYVEIAEEFCKVVTDSKEYTVQITKEEMKAELATQTFVQVHQKYIVNTDTIEEFNTKEGILILKDNYKIAFSEEYKENINILLN